MERSNKYFIATICLLLIFLNGFAQQPKGIDPVEKSFLNPPQSAKPWVFWYWMHGAISKEGITADLEAMKEVGIGGAYLMTIKDTSSAIPFQTTARQLTPEWWAMVKHAMQEAKRLGLQLGMHVSDGFALAGGPWITPELSMQKIVWTKTYARSESAGKINLERPESYNGFYKDIAVFAYPANSAYSFSNEVLVPSVTASNGTKPQFLSFINAANKESFRSDTACWIQYKYPEKFTCRSVRIHVGGNSYQAQRLIIQASDDGINFKIITRLESPRHGWQDTDEDYTHAIPATTAKYFRFVYSKEGSEPGAEDLDAAKWKPSLKLMGLYLSDEPVINQYEAKNGSIWRVAMNTTTQQVDARDAVPFKSIIDLTGKLDNEGNLNWKAPKGNWVIVRIGHTSTAQTNATGGAAKGLECDKFNASAVKLQFDNWFGKIYEKTDPQLAKEVVKVFHVDSWECGSQNWSSNFANEFKKRRGYDLAPYLLVMTGVPVESAVKSEKILHDVRTTIAELVNDVFYVTLKKLSAVKGCKFSAESIAPTFVSDGLLHYKNVDLPMGEFWLNSPTHDKPNDMLDAISGAHIYGKNIIQAEAFTSVRMNWGEHPGNLKAIGDRNFASGINKMILHVWAHNPWMDRKPGMTLDGVGLYFQRDQTWFKQSKAWIDYLTRCQAFLQMGKPIVDIAVFTGEEVPRRSVLPDRLVNFLPGIFGNERTEVEKKRLANTGQPMRQIPDGVSHSANMADPEDWVDPLNGYKYDCVNPDVLMQMKVVNGRVTTPGGESYAVLVIPGKHPMNPNGTMSTAVLSKLKQLASTGAKIIIDKEYIKSFNNSKNVVAAPYVENSLERFAVKKDVIVEDRGHPVAWTHRKTANTDIYFISNQYDTEQFYNLSFRVNDRAPELWDVVNNKQIRPVHWIIEKGRVFLNVTLAPRQSLFVVFSKKGEKNVPNFSRVYDDKQLLINSEWDIQFKSISKNSKTNDPGSWSLNSDSVIKYYGGSATYTNSFTIDKKYAGSIVTLKLDSIYNIATVKVNGFDCGTIWTPPYELDISKAIKQGENIIEIEVTNTWHNRLIGDALLPPEKRTTWTTAPFRLKDKPLLPAGLIGEVKLLIR